MKKAIIILVILISSVVNAADPNLIDFTAVTTPAATDLVYLVRDPAGSPLDKKITYANFLASWIGSTSITTLGTIGTGVWNGTAIVDAYVANNITIDLATLATTVTVEDETTDTTCFPAFVTAATGSLGGKTAASLAFNSNTGALSATSLLEGANAVPNATDHLGFFGGTTSAQLLDEISDETGTGKAVFATAPSFTTSILLTGANADPAGAGTIVYDNDVTGMSGGGLRWYDNNSVRILVDLETDATDDDHVVAYDADADGFYMKDDDNDGGATAYDDIGDPDAASIIDFDDDETVTWTTAEDSAGSFFTINDSDADVAANTYLMHLIYSVDDDQDNADYFKCEDAGGVVFNIQEDGDTNIDGFLAVGVDSHHTISLNGVTKEIQFSVHGDDVANKYVSYMDRASDTHSPTMIIARARGIHAAPTQVVDNDILGQFGFFGWDDTDNDMNFGAKIMARVHGDAGNNDLPTEIVLALAPDGAATTTEQVTFYDGVFAPITDDDIDIGTAAAQFKDGYFDGTLEADVITLNGNAVVSETVATGAMIFGDSTPDSDGEFGFDTDGDGATITSGVINAHDGTEAIYFFGSAGYPGADNNILKYDAGTHKVVWEADADSGGAPDYDDIADPTGSGSISFDAAETGIYTSSDDEWVGITISNTHADLDGDSELLTLAFTDDGDTNSHYLIMSDAAGTQQLEVIQSSEDVQVTATTGLNFVADNVELNGWLTIYDTTIDTTVAEYGLKVNTIKTAGATDQADNMYGVYSSMQLNDGDSTIGDLVGGYFQSTISAGTIGVGTDDVLGIQSIARLNGGTAADDFIGLYQEVDINLDTVTDDVLGVHINIDIEEAVTAVGGDVFGLKIDIDDDQGATGTVYGVYLNEADGIDYGIYQNGTAANLLGGALNVVGAVTVGTATSAAGNLSLYDAGVLTLYEDGDNFNITLNCADGEAVGTLTGGLDVTGALNGGTLTEGADIAVYNANEIEGVLAVGGSDTIFPADPDADRILMWDDDPGALVWTAGGAGDMTKAVYDSGASGGVDMLTTVDSTYAGDYVLLIGGAVTTAAPKTDGALTYDATSGTLAATEFSGGGSGLTLASTDLSDTADLLYETELSDLSELTTQISDVSTFITDDIMPATGTDPDVDAVGEFSIDSDGANEPNDVVLRSIDGGNTPLQIALCQQQKSFQCTIITPNDLADATRDALPFWENNTGMSFVVTKIRAWSDTDNTEFNVETVDSDWDNNATVDAVNIQTDEVAMFSTEETTITANTIAADSLIVLDFDDTDDPGWVKISICGYFLADVD